MRIADVFFCLAILGVGGSLAAAAAARDAVATRDFIGAEGARQPCDVTTPNGVSAGPWRGNWSHGNEALSSGPFGVRRSGEVVFRAGGPGFVTPDGALGMKFGWQRGIAGALEITGRRLDADAPPLRSEVPDGYGEIGFHASYVIFPTPGCWEVTARVADAIVTFITEVVLIGDGPSWRRGGD